MVRSDALRAGGEALLDVVLAFEAVGLGAPALDVGEVGLPVAA